LQSIMPCPDIFRNFITVAAAISAMSSTPVLFDTVFRFEEKPGNRFL
jgi:hypothetical protein